MGLAAEPLLGFGIAVFCYAARVNLSKSDSVKGQLKLAVRFAREVGAGVVARDGTPKLVFHKYANKYFLSQVSRGFGHSVMQLPISKLEKELQIASAGGASAQETVVAAK